MKKHLLVALLCSAGMFRASAQTQKGTLFVGASVGTTTYSQSTNDYSYPDGGTKDAVTHAYSLSMTPQVGVFVTNHLVLAGNLGVSYTHNRTTANNTETSPSSSITTTNSTTVDLGPMLRYYFYESRPLRTMLYLQAQGTVGIGAGNTTGSGGSPTSTYTSSGTTSGIVTWTGGGYLGVTHWIRPDIGIDFGLGYLHSYEHSDVTNSTVTTNSTTGGQTTKPNNYTLGTNTDGFTALVAFHWYLRPHGKA
ncbi:outer membrane beta-barrel protein [Dinghuibacter silviterrae]|uniref:Outer membrane protein with beta-barrel domain n=1 Tax=Dinghuibacter silviterrae TaxID=1539049 RepID=A0A4R8DIQ7_9BACT|nr:outer membrane beta-barrel protein [Dinghuibacter silviterrae]TDW97194.1 outer membrane protein with beta-barrel domain [Dinghuibacter silviterrae]